jgi:O-succinylhomoserine sulfhydrylase
MKKKENQEGWQVSTKLVRGGTLRSNFGETSEAIFMNSGFCYDSAEIAESRFNGEAPGFVYSRYSNPTLAMLEERLRLLEGAEAACVVASGMAAVFAAIACQVRPGEHLIASKVLFGSCYYIATQILPRLGVEVTLVDGKNLAEWERAFKKNTKYVFIETPSNPNLELVDIEAVARLCKAHGAFFIVDNVFASPLYQHPLALGADCVIYSTTKHIEGQGRALGGAVLGSSEFITEKLIPFHRHTGPAMSPFNAWVTLKGLETLDIRMQRHCDNAEKVAKFLESSDKISRVIYPGLPSHPQFELAQRQMDRGGNLIAFELKGGKEAAFKFMNKLKIVDISNNLGDSKTLLTHPATTTHSNIEAEERKKLDITDGMLRISVGLESADDLVADLAQALG